MNTLPTQNAPGFIQSFLDNKAQKDREYQALNQRYDALFDAFLTLPICVPLSHDTVEMRTLINSVNGITLSIGKAPNNNIFPGAVDRIFPLKIRPIPIKGTDTTLTGIPLKFEEAEKLLEAWTLMCKPYFVMNWQVNSKARASQNQK